MDRLIVMDDVSGTADGSHKFAEFLTVCRKYRYHYIPRNCLTNASSRTNKNGPGRYPTQASDPEKQVCYFNQLYDDELYNVLISNRIKAGNFSNSIYFKINQVQGKNEIFDAEKTLKEDDAYDGFSKLDTVSKQLEFYRGSRKQGMRKLLSTLLEGLPLPENQLNLNFLQDNNYIPQKPVKTKYNNTKVKSRNLITNVSYRRYKPEDVQKVNFVVDAFSFLTQILNPTGLDRKRETALERDYVKMIWDT